jgi:retinol-binding protein 3
MGTLRTCVIWFATTLHACTRAPAPPAPAAAQEAGASTAPSDLGAEERARVLAAVGDELTAHYVFPDMGVKMATTLRARAARGEYDGITNATELARVVTAAMREVSHDAHAMLERAPSPAEATADDAKWERIFARNRATAGFGATTWLPGNVAQVAIESFEPVDAARATIAARMTEVAGAAALILDLRENHGGDPATVALLASYLFDETPVHLNDMWWRDDGSLDTFFTLRTVTGKRFGAVKPVVVLTSHATFSAGEELAYDLQVLHRATLVGETTRGGAHPVALRKLSPLFTLRVPTGRAINPVTKTNWEGTGVTPDVEATAGDAPAAAEHQVKLALTSRAAAVAR